MKFCQSHWDTLREELKNRGLSAYVAKSGQALASRVADATERGETLANFDPLMFCHNGLLGNVMGRVGPEVIQDNPDGSERCPLCFITAKHTAECKDPKCTVKNFDVWIVYAVDQAEKRIDELAAKDMASGDKVIN